VGGVLPCALYHSAPSRGLEVARQMLGDIEGFLQTDGYEVYDRLCEGLSERDPDRVLVSREAQVL
jgi:hypothetical protein